MITVGAEAAIRALSILRVFHGQVVQDTVRDYVDLVLAESKRLVPKDTHRLDQSASTKIKGRSWRTEGKVIFSTEYAWPVHEDPDASHTPPTQYKYLTQAVKNVQAKMRGKLKIRLHGKVGKRQ